MVTITVRPFLLTFLTLCITIAAARASKPAHIDRPQNLSGSCMPVCCQVKITGLESCGLQVLQPRLNFPQSDNQKNPISL